MKAILIAGTHSGSGKTTITLGLLRALARRGNKVQPFKVGPDYIDTAWHSRVAGIPSRNLDEFMLPESALKSCFYRQARHADIAIIEGVMGLYDGYGTDPHYGSGAGIARMLGCPVILVVDARAVSTSVAATVMGFRHFDPDLNLAGVIFNHVSSEVHYDLLKRAVETYTDVTVLGRIPKIADIELPSRHLGLMTAQESEQYDDKWDLLAEQIEAHVDLDQLISLAGLADEPPEEDNPEQQAIQAALKSLGDGLTLALASDKAFNFYYQDNLDLLNESGVTIVLFSPLEDSRVPECDLIYIGGGYPEIHAQALASNTDMLASLREAHQQGIPIYAECGGLMYLGESLADSDDRNYTMAGVLPGKSHMTSSLKRFGYCYATAETDTLIARQGEVLRGHEFHYSEFTTGLTPAFTLHKERDGEILTTWRGGYQVGNTFATYLHLHFAQSPALLLNWFKRAGKHQ